MKTTTGVMDMNKTGLAVIVGSVLIAGAGFGVNQMFAGESDPALTAKEAAQIAEECYPGVVEEIELDDKGTRHVYKIELVGPEGGYEVKMDANTGEVLKVEQGKPAMGQGKAENERKDDNRSDLHDADDDREVKSEPVQEKPKKERSRISYEEAKKIALNRFNGTIEEIELDEDDGRLIYEVEIVSGNRDADMEIDAYTGEILFLSVDHDD
jgi:uncharacterized membrane protein YkoI